jgi:hypothetical protein
MALANHGEQKMKIEITTDIGVWVNDAPCKEGDVVEVDDKTGKTIIANGHAVAKTARKSAKKSS